MPLPTYRKENLLASVSELKPPNKGKFATFIIKELKEVVF
jgi:hypothetical protein